MFGLITQLFLAAARQVPTLIKIVNSAFEEKRDLTQEELDQIRNERKASERALFDLYDKLKEE